MRLSLCICWNRIIFIFLKCSFAAAGAQYWMKCGWHLADFHSFCLGSCPVSGGPLGFTWPWCNRRFQLARGQEGNPTLEGGMDGLACGSVCGTVGIMFIKSNIDVVAWNVSNFLFPTWLPQFSDCFPAMLVVSIKQPHCPGCAQKSSEQTLLDCSDMFYGLTWCMQVKHTLNCRSSGRGTKRITMVNVTWAWIHVHCRTAPLGLNLQDVSSRFYF